MESSLQYYDAKNNQYRIKKVKGPISGMVEVPGSKSITNRALCIAAMGIGKAKITGALFSDDSRHVLKCLKDLGFKLDIFEDEKEVDIIGMGGIIPRSTATIDVGSAGTAARFLTAMLGFSGGEYTINCSKQMASRPMKELFDILSGQGAEIEYLGKKGHLPIKIKGCGLLQDRAYSKHDRADKEIDITVDISESTQYLSALLMIAPSLKHDVKIHVKSDKKIGSYIKITIGMLKKFGVDIKVDEDTYIISGRKKPVVGKYHVEPDISAACYFYALAAITRGKVIVKNVHFSTSQGDAEFIEVLQVMGCEVKDLEPGIEVSGPLHLHGVDVDMNDFSDQALTLAAISPYVDSPMFIRNVGHIRGQECDRMAAIIDNLANAGIDCEIEGDDILIYPSEPPQATVINTYDDHRVAMAFTVMGVKTHDIVIDNPMCCSKTFENFYEVFEGLVYNNEMGYEDLY